MFSTYSDIAPLVILLTLILSLLIGWNIKRENLRGIDGIFAVLGFIFGLFMTVTNLIYTSNALFLLSPVIAISCLLYLRYRNEFKEGPRNFLLEISPRNNMIFNIIWWSLISAALITYYLSEVYTRHPLFFIFIAGAVAVLGIQIIAFHCPNGPHVFVYIVKILVLSIILRASAYFISPYPIGSDPWEHSKYISYFLDYGRIAVPQDFSIYYINYPMAHLHAACTSLLTSISPHNAMFLLGVILTFSTVVTFLIVRMLTGNVQLALISMLLLNFADAHIQWSIQVIAMSFGIAIYAFIIFFALKISLKPQNKIKYTSFMLVFLGIIVWTHTISAFITLVSLFALIVGYILYEILYNHKFLSFRSQNAQLLMIPLTFLAILIIYHWMDPTYSFFDQIFVGLIKSLSMEAEFLGATTLSNVSGRWEELLQPAGFCLYAFFGVIGTLYCSSYKDDARKYFPVIVLAVVLFFVRYVFPIFGMRNIIPDRWPAFAFVCFSLFIGLGIFCAMGLLKTKRAVLCTIVIVLFIGSFLMITNAGTNQDSPLYGGEVIPKLIWTESEMKMYAHINETYKGTIFADVHTAGRPFEVYLKTNCAGEYSISQYGQINKDVLSQGLVVWRMSSLNRPTSCRDAKYMTNLLLGDEFYQYLDNNFSCVIDVYEGRGFL